MFIIYSGPQDKYASAAVSSRDGNKTKMQTTYLGTVIDRDKGIYYNRKQEFFTFDPITEQYSEAPNEMVIEKRKIKADGKKHVSVDNV